MTDALTTDTSINKDGSDAKYGIVILKQEKDDWQSDGADNLNSIFVDSKGRSHPTVSSPEGALPRSTLPEYERALHF